MNQYWKAVLILLGFILAISFINFTTDPDGEQFKAENCFEVHIGAGYGWVDGVWHNTEGEPVAYSETHKSTAYNLKECI